MPTKVSTDKKHTRKKTAPRKKKKAPSKQSGSFFWWVLALCALGIGALIYLRPESPVEWEYGAAVPQSLNGQFGIDISHNNPGNIEWGQLIVMMDKDGRTTRDLEAAKEVRPVTFVFMKATEGQEMVDRNFRKNWEQAGEHGIERGAYHFFRTSKDPVRQARNFIRTVGELRDEDLPPVLDIETTHKGLTRKQLNSKLRSWLDTVEKHYGRKPIIYTYDSFALDWLDKDLLKEYPVWIAHYEADRPVFKDWKYWQFTDKALIYGMEGKVDLSIRRSR